jgi:hypothetical protein
MTDIYEEAKRKHCQTYVFELADFASECPVPDE